MKNWISVASVQVASWCSKYQVPSVQVSYRSSHWAIRFWNDFRLQSERKWKLLPLLLTTRAHCVESSHTFHLQQPPLKYFSWNHTHIPSQATLCVVLPGLGCCSLHVRIGVSAAPVAASYHGKLSKHVQYPVIYAVLLRLNRCNSFSHCRAMLVEKRKKKRRPKVDDSPVLATFRQSSG